MDRCDRLIAEGHEHASCANEADQCDEAAAMKVTNNMFKINSDAHDSNSSMAKCKLASFSLPCSCRDCRNENFCPRVDARNSEVHEMKLKERLVTHSDVERKAMSIGSLTTPQLKVQLLSRKLSTSHEVILELVQRLLIYLAIATTAFFSSILCKNKKIVIVSCCCVLRDRLYSSRVVKSLFPCV